MFLLLPPSSECVCSNPSVSTMLMLVRHSLCNIRITKFAGHSGRRLIKITLADSVLGMVFYDLTRQSSAEYCELTSSTLNRFHPGQSNSCMTKLTKPLGPDETKFGSTAIASIVLLQGSDNVRSVQ